MSSAQCLPVKRWREVVMRRCWWWGDGGDDSGGIATGTQKRGSKQGEALTSACFTFERQRGRREEEERERERGTDWRSRKKQDRRKKRDKQWRGGGGKKSTGRSNVSGATAGIIRQVQFSSAATWRRQRTGSHTHEAAGCSQAAAARGHYCAAQAASNPPQVFPVVWLHPITQIPQHHWLEGKGKMSVRRWKRRIRERGTLSGKMTWMLPCWGRWGCWRSPPRTHSSPCLRWGSWSDPALPPWIWASLTGCSLKHTKAGGQRPKHSGV